MSVAPLVREVLVPADPAVAFTVFTARIGTWWPLDAYGVHGRDADVAFVDGRIVETAPGRPDAVWGTVDAWDPPHRVTFSWHPGRPERAATFVEVTFRATGEGTTLVRLEHSGWEACADPEGAREEYENGWPSVLAKYASAAAGAAGIWTWVALLHTPAAQDVAPGGLFADPRFALHADFLQRMAAAGILVAAGPFADGTGAGMTILRLPGEGREDELARLATADDRSVASGFLAVEVRPWRVVRDGIVPR